MKKTIILTMMLLCTSLVFAATCGTGSTDGMVSYWAFDAGNATDDYDSNPGTLIGDTINTSGKVNSALSFDGNGDYVNVTDADNLDFTTALTIEAWIQIDAFGVSTIHTMFPIVNKATTGDGYSFGIYNVGSAGQNRIVLFDGATWRTGNTIITTGPAWRHIAVVYNGSNVEFYLDGVPDGSQGANNLIPNTDPVHIGYRAYSASQYWFSDGKIDEVAMYNRALSASEIEEHFLAGNSSQPLCTLSGQETIPEVSSKTLQIFVILIVALLIGTALMKKN